MQTKFGRNDSCPCGSGKKYKRCCMSGDSSRALTAVHAPMIDAPTRDEHDEPNWSPQTFTPRPRAERPRDEWDDWYDDFQSRDFAEKLDMLRALLAEDHPADYYSDREFVSVIFDISPGPVHENYAPYVAFLEEFMDSRQDVFASGAEWYVHEIAYSYIQNGKPERISRLLDQLLVDNFEPTEPAFDLVDLLRLAGLEDESRRLLHAMLEKRDKDLVPWAIEELIELYSYFLETDAIEAGSPAEALETLRSRLRELDCNPSDEYLHGALAHRAGTSARRIGVKDVCGTDEATSFNLYLLSLDFGRWLVTQRNMPPLVADTMRYFQSACICKMRPDGKGNPLLLQRKPLDEHLATLIGFLSLNRLRAVGTLIAMWHFQDFLLSANLIDEKAHRRGWRVCDELWPTLQRALQNLWPNFAFIERYVPA